MLKKALIGFLMRQDVYLRVPTYIGWHRKLKPFNNSTGLHNHKHRKARNALVMPNKQ